MFENTKKPELYQNLRKKLVEACPGKHTASQVLDLEFSQKSGDFAE